MMALRWFEIEKKKKNPNTRNKILKTEWLEKEFLRFDSFNAMQSKVYTSMMYKYVCFTCKIGERNTHTHTPHDTDKEAKREKT